MVNFLFQSKHSVITLLLLLAGFSISFSAVSVTDNMPQPINSIHIPTNKESGLMLDIARHFYPVEVIKEFIDSLHDSGATFLHLHFSDHENYALESTLLNQRIESAIKNDEEIYINPQTDKPFLSYAQIKEIATYAKTKQIELIPELDSPNHMTAIFTLLAKYQGEDYVQSLKSKWNDAEIDITNPDSIAFMQSLITEVSELFGDSSRHFHIGGDEFGYSVESNHEFIRYANALSDFLTQRGLIARMWNDGVIQTTLNQLNPNIEITYWSHDGDTQNAHIARERRQIRASLPELILKGFNVLNYNSYYLYINPKQGAVTSYDSNYAMRDALANWELGVWDGQNRQNALTDTDKILGGAFSIWGEDAGSLSAASIQKYNAELLETIIRKINAAGNDTFSRQLTDLSANDFAALLQTTYLDLTQAKNDTVIQLEKYPQQVKLLGESAVQDLILWIQGAKNHRLILASFWQPSGLFVDKYNQRFQLYKCANKKLWIQENIQVQMPVLH